MTTSVSANAAAKEVFDLLRDDLLAIEEEFQRDAVSGVEVITEIGEYLREGGGKRIRPALLLLAAKLCGYDGQGAVRLGSVVEIVHTATLVHDDIIDEALTRRAALRRIPNGEIPNASWLATGSTCKRLKSLSRNRTSESSIFSSV